jgi:hypothetical protein
MPGAAALGFRRCPRKRGLLRGDCALAVVARRSLPQEPEQSPGRIANATPLLGLVIHRRAPPPQAITKRKSGAISAFSCPACIPGGSQATVVIHCAAARTCLACDPPRAGRSAQAGPDRLSQPAGSGTIGASIGKDRLKSFRNTFFCEIPPREDEEVGFRATRGTSA